ncbi:MAG: glycosyltransferase [Mycobacterium sp.]|nr:glycosyltransferase [Mycobacterium sp.]
MKFVIAVHGTRGDVEPCAAVGCELQRRGHDVALAVPPNLVGFVESTGLPPALPYGVDSQQQLESEAFQDHWKIRNPISALRSAKEYVTQGWAQMNETLTALAADADLILTGTTYQEVAANVAEHYGIPLAALHYFPARVNHHVVPVPLPRAVLKAGWTAIEWGHWRLLKEADDAQRDQLGIPKSQVRAVRRMIDGGALEIQAYDKVLFPGLAEEWRGLRPIVGSITMGLGTSTDDEVASWVAAGTPPIYFGFGSMPVDSPIEAVAMITAVCAELGERALISSGVWDLSGVQQADHVKIVGSVNHAAVFPTCRAVVHHGGSGTTAASLRSGVPTVVLWVNADQPVWAAQVKKLGAGVSRRFSATTPASLAAALREVLTPKYAARAREVAAQMTTPADSVAAAADLLEDAVRGDAAKPA